MNNFPKVMFAVAAAIALSAIVFLSGCTTGRGMGGATGDSTGGRMGTYSSSRSAPGSPLGNDERTWPENGGD